MADQAGEKTEEATPKKRQDSRKKGSVARSRDLGSAMSLASAALIAPSVVHSLGKVLSQTVHQSIAYGTTSVSSSEALTRISQLALPAFASIAPLFLVLLCIGLTVSFAQVGFVLTLEPLAPKFERIDPFKGFKRLFSLKPFVEGGKASIKFVMFGYLAYVLITADWHELTSLASLTPNQALVAFGRMLHLLALRIGFAWLALAALDYFFERKHHDKELRMTRDELKREMREQEGSPELKGAQIRRRREMSKKAGLASRLSDADVVVVNPTHYAVALQYKRNEMHAPLVVAKGLDYLALRIKQIARENNVPIVENPPLARALYSNCEVGDFVPREHFGAVAEVLAFVFRASHRSARHDRDSSS